MDRIHGGPDPEELERLGLAGLDLDRLLDFSVNVSPYGRLPALERAIARGPAGSLPRGARRAGAAGAGRGLGRAGRAGGAGQRRGGVAVHAGAVAVRGRTDAADGGADVLGAGGGRGGLGRAAGQPGAPGNRMASGWTSAAVAQAARRCGAAAVYLCNPQNPTGRALAIEEVAALAAGAGPPGRAADPGRSVPVPLHPLGRRVSGRCPPTSCGCARSPRSMGSRACAWGR